jgi:microcystin-dependent protein
MSEAYIGEIRMFGGNFAIKNWAMCNGQTLSISTNTALFSILGTTYGGNGQTTFMLPDLRSRVPVHFGQGSGLSNYALGQASGTENVTLTQNQMPQHTHSFTPAANANAGAGARPGGGYLANSGSASLYEPSSDGTTMGAQTIGPAGGNQPFPVLQPLLAINFQIVLYGIFPSRN